VLPGVPGIWSPAVDIYETGDSWIVFMELPGLTSDDIELTIGDSSVVVRGAKLPPLTGCAAASLEISTGHFVREILTPGRIDGESVTASMKNGLLRILLPRLAPGKVVIRIDQE
jgi:HSP20 family protein